MKVRTIATVAGVLAVLSAGVAGASSGPMRLQQRAAAQTKLLFRELNGPQTASPAMCNEGQRPEGIRGEFMLPALSFGSGDATFSCYVKAHVVLLDLGGAIATEDNRGDTYTTADGEVLLFTRGNLQRICDDALRFFPAPAPATADSNPISARQVSTRAFEVKVNSSAPAPYWQDSVDLGHPGRLAAAYCGWKAEVPLDRGQHVIQVDLTSVAGAPTHFTYNITVDRGHPGGKR
jgi:hypothetical protein